MEPEVKREPRVVRFSLRLKLTVGLILIIGIIFTAVNIRNLFAHSQARRAEAIANSETIARLVAGAILDELGQGSPLDSASVRRVVSTFLNFGLILNRRNQDLAFAVVVDNENRVVAGRAKPDLTLFPGEISLADEDEVLAKVAVLQGRLGASMKTKRFPLKLSKDDPPVGMVIVGTSMRRLEKDLHTDLLVTGAILGGTLLILILYSAWILRNLVLRPLTMVADAMRQVQKGDLDQEVQLETSDELGVLADTFNYMVGGLREQERLKDAFTKYVSEKVYARFREGAISLDGETREATILFSDIRSFTTLSEQLTAPQVVEMLNEYFSEMVDIVIKYDGFINKFIGDALMAIYNVPVDQDQPELRAVKTGIEMMTALDILNYKREQRGEFPIHIGIGINTGPVVAGNIGHARRLEYTVIGDAVNLASRIESQTKVAGATLLISESTYAKVADFIEVEALPPVKVKGKAEAVNLYAVKALKSDGDNLVLSSPALPQP